MRRLLAFVFLLTLITSCKEKVDDTTPDINTSTVPAAADTVDCNIPVINNIPETGTYSEILDYLREQEEICNGTLVECLEKFHIIRTETEFTTLAQSHPENQTQIKYYEAKWIELEKFIDPIKCYDEFVGFVLNDDGSVSFKKNPEFRTDEAYYSKPFLTGLGKKHSLDSDDVLHLTKTASGTGNEYKVIIRLEVKNAGTTKYIYYDISDNPTFIGEGK